MRGISTIRTLLVSAIAVMGGALLSASLSGNGFEAYARLLRDPWMRVTLVDFYLLVAIFSAWVFYRERSLLRGLAWTLAFCCLGSIGVAGYALLALRGADGPGGAERFFRGSEQ